MFKIVLARGALQKLLTANHKVVPASWALQKVRAVNFSFPARRALPKLQMVNFSLCCPLAGSYKNCKQSSFKLFPVRGALQK